MGFRQQVLALAVELGSVVEASRRAGISRTTFYAWRRRVQASEPAGSSPPKGVRGSHVRAIAPDLRARIEELALAHPGWGCDRVAEMLGGGAQTVSAGTVQNVLNDRRLGTRAERCAVLQRDPDGVLSPEQEVAVSRQNPRWAERHQRGRAPGARMVAGAAPLGRLDALGRVTLVAVVDSYSGHAFARLATADGPPVDPVSLLADGPLRSFAGISLPPGCIALDPSAVLRFRPVGATSRGAALAGSFDLDAEPDGRPAVSGWIKHFRQLVLLQVFRPATAGGNHPPLAVLAKDLEVWLRGHNHDRSQPGFPCYGSTPWAVIEAWRQRRRRARQGIAPASVLACLAFAIPTKAHVSWENHPDHYSALRPEVRCVILPGMS